MQRGSRRLSQGPTVNPLQEHDRRGRRSSPVRTITHYAFPDAHAKLQEQLIISRIPIGDCLLSRQWDPYDPWMTQRGYGCRSAQSWTGPRDNRFSEAIP